MIPMVCRLDLDGTYNPLGLVSKILEASPNLELPVPIEKLAHALDIREIQHLQTAGFEGGLITDKERSVGAILVRKGVGIHRRRFTIAHELGHFLIIHHRPVDEEKGFLCDRQSMSNWDRRSKDAYVRMEAEANQFAALILMPPPFLRPMLNGEKWPSLGTIEKIQKRFGVSKEAAARTYAEYTDNVAVVVCKDRKYLYSYRNRKFPWITLRNGQPIPADSLLHKSDKTSGITHSDETAAEYWIDTERGKPVQKMYEQVMPLSKGFALILLRISGQDEEFDPMENLTSKERLRLQQERWGNR